IVGAKLSAQLDPCLPLTRSRFHQIEEQGRTHGNGGRSGNDAHVLLGNGIKQRSGNHEGAAAHKKKSGKTGQTSKRARRPRSQSEAAWAVPGLNSVCAAHDLILERRAFGENRVLKPQELEVAKHGRAVLPFHLRATSAARNAALCRRRRIDGYFFSALGIHTVPAFLWFGAHGRAAPFSGWFLRGSCPARLLMRGCGVYEYIN